MKQRLESFTVTLHWLVEHTRQQTTIVLEDCPPAELIPLLLRGCRLPGVDQTGRARFWRLRLDTAGGRQLDLQQPLACQGVRTGAHLWLVEEQTPGRRRYLLQLPDGSELLVPRGGVALTRSWLLQGFALLNPEAHRQELGRIERRDSPFCYVSSRPHCLLAPVDDMLAVSTERSDVCTLLNGERLGAKARSTLRDGDRLTIGEGGPTLAISSLREVCEAV